MFGLTGDTPRVGDFGSLRLPDPGLTNPLTEIEWYSAFWAGDDQWTTAMPSVAYMGADGLVLPGTAGNYASVPDAAALDITSDITLVCRAALTDWTPAASATLLGKWSGSDPNRSYRLQVLGTTGVLQMIWSPTGNFADTITVSSTVAPTVIDGATLWVAATLDVNNGAGGYDVKFWTSSDGTTWAQLGTTVTGGSTTSIAAGAQMVEFGTAASSSATHLAGTVSVARVYSGSAFTTAGPGGSLVLDADFRRANAASFTCDTGQVVTINSGAAVSAWRNGGTLATSGADLSTSGLTLPGVAGNYASVPDAAALDITGDITLVGYLTPSDWTPGTALTVQGKWGASAAYLLRVNTTGALRLDWVDSGAVARNAGSTASVAFADGTAGYVAATLDVDNGAGGYDVKFWTSTNGTTWTQLGTTLTVAGTTSIQATTDAWQAGLHGAGGTAGMFSGTIHRAWVYSGSGFSAAGPSGSLVLDADFRVAGNPTTFTASTGQTVTRYSTFSANQSTGASQPTFRSANSVLNNRPVVDFDGTDDRLEITTGVSLAQPFSVVWVGTYDAAVARRFLGHSGDGSMGSGATAVHHLRSGATITGGTVVINTAYMVNNYINSTSSSITANGTSIVTGDAGVLTVDRILLGCGPGYVSFLDGKTAFLGIYSGDITTHPNWPAFKTWVAQHYGVAVA